MGTSIWVLRGTRDLDGYEFVPWGGRSSFALADEWMSQGGWTWEECYLEERGLLMTRCRCRTCSPQPAFHAHADYAHRVLTRICTNDEMERERRRRAGDVG